MKNYIIPYGERYVQVERGFSRTLKTVDNLGLVVHHAPGSDISDDVIRNRLVGYNNQDTVLIQAETSEEAIQKFYDFPEAKEGTKHRAWTLEDSETNPIIEYAHCPFMKQDITCGAYDDEYTDEGSYAICVLNGADILPDECPIALQQETNEYKLKTIGGIWIKSYV